MYRLQQVYEIWQIIWENENTKLWLCGHRSLCKDVSFVSGVVPKNAFKCKVKPRYRKEDSEAEIHMLDDKNAKVTFKEKQRAITKGQSAVFYDGDIVLGGGIIAE